MHTMWMKIARRCPSMGARRVDTTEAFAFSLLPVYVGRRVFSSLVEPFEGEVVHKNDRAVSSA